MYLMLDLGLSLLCSTDYSMPHCPLNVSIMLKIMLVVKGLSSCECLSLEGAAILRKSCHFDELFITAYLCVCSDFACVQDLALVLETESKSVHIYSYTC